MAWEKSPQELAERFGRVLDRFPDAERRKMFGCPAAFEPVPGRPMKNFVALPAAIIADDEAVAGWVKRAIAHGKTLPPKR